MRAPHGRQRAEQAPETVTQHEAPHDVAIRGGTVVLEDGMVAADLIVDGERISAIALPGTAGEARATLDATGCYVMPGAVDAHVHVHIPYVRPDGSTPYSRDDFPSASRAAAVGGTTTFIDFAMQGEGQEPLAAVAERKATLAGASVDVALHCWLVDVRPDFLAQLPAVVAEGIPSFKAFMAYSQSGEAMDDGSLLALFEAAAACGALVAVHAENARIIRRRTAELLAHGHTRLEYLPRSRPPISEEEAVVRALTLAAAADCALYVVHLSTAAGAARLRAAQAAGQRVIGETCPHFLVFTEEVYRGPRAADFVVSPPLRTAPDQEALWDRLADGTLSVIATDHAAWARADKVFGPTFRETVHGLSGLGLLLPVVAPAAFTRGWDAVALARVTATAPARVFGIYPQKGALRVGADADVLIVDPSWLQPIATVPPYSSVDYSIYEGLPGLYPRAVLARGRLLARDGVYVGPEGGGHFVPGTPVRP
jgi:dihydropyrimidinase